MMRHTKKIFGLLSALAAGGVIYACSSDESATPATDAGIDTATDTPVVIEDSSSDAALDLKGKIKAEKADSSWHMYAVEWARSPKVNATNLINFGGDGGGLPDGGNAGTLDMSWNFYVLVGYNKVVLIDSGSNLFATVRTILPQCAPDSGVDAGAAICAGVNFLYGYWKFEEARPVVQALAQTGVTPEEVTDVVVTHFHYDHSMGMFSVGPNAKIHMIADEWATTRAYYAGAEGQQIGGAALVTGMDNAADAGRVGLTSGATATPVPGITILEKGKHTAHSVIVKVDCGGKPVTVLMDAAYTYRNIDEKLPTSVNTDKAMNVSDVQELVAEAKDAGGIYLPGHDRLMMDKPEFKTSNPLVARICGK